MFLRRKSTKGVRHPQEEEETACHQGLPHACCCLVSSFHSVFCSFCKLVHDMHEDILSEVKYAESHIL